MTTEDKIHDLLTRWEECRRNGENVPAEQLCRDFPELLECVRTKIQALIRWEKLDAPSVTDLQSESGLYGDKPALLGYTYVKQCGRGGSGEVWKAINPDGIEIALKFVQLNKPLGKNERLSVELIKELKHDNLLPIFESQVRGGWLIIEMELASGTLQALLEKLVKGGSPGIPRDELLQQMKEVANGIDYLNAWQEPGAKHCGIQHRDIKPANLLLVGERVKIGDFGLARIIQHSMTANTGLATEEYAPPEFFDGKTSEYYDQYSLALTYCRLRRNMSPFTGTRGEQMRKKQGGFAELSTLPIQERCAVARALDKTPKARWPNCRAFVEALRQSASASLGSNGIVSKDIVRAESRLRFVGRTSNLRILDTATNIANSSRVQDVQKQWADHLRLPVTFVLDIGNDVTLEMVLVPPGKFMMGSPADERGRRDDEVCHHVELSRPFFLGKFPVTQEQYVQVMRVANPSYFRPGGGGQEQIGGKDTRRFPVENVSASDAETFCGIISAEFPVARFAAFQLPTEAQWEYACRAGTRTRFCFGNELTRSQANFGSGFDACTSAVGSFATWANALGLFDMHGNVREWCRDYFDPDYYRNSPASDPECRTSTGNDRVRRGGDWSSTEQYCRCASRDVGTLASKSVGFRVALVQA